MHHFDCVYVCVCVCVGEWSLESPDWDGAMDEDQALVTPVSRSCDYHMIVVTCLVISAGSC